jgi:Bacterial PH domain
MSEHEFEAVRGIPGDLPEGESVLWQGAPDWVHLAFDAFKIGWVGAYFAALIIWRCVNGVLQGNDPAAAISTALAVTPLAGLAIFILGFLSWVNSRSTVYTITNQRVIMRFGAALTKAINIPFKIIESASADIKANKAGHVAVKLLRPNKIPMLLLWPHVKPGSWRQPEPALRALKDGGTCAQVLGAALRVAHDQARAVASVLDAEPEIEQSAQPVLA